MKATELRIGNLGYDVINGRDVSILGINSTWNDVWVRYLNGSADYKIDVNDFVPHKLTEDWLLRFGFEKDEYNENVYTLDSFDICFGWGFGENENHWHYAYDFEKGDGYSCLWKAIDFVHQLQNLYFALTGEELEINN